MLQKPTPPPNVDRQAPVKTLPFRNFVCGRAVKPSSENIQITCKSGIKVVKPPARTNNKNISDGIEFEYEKIQSRVFNHFSN